MSNRKPFEATPAKTIRKAAASIELGDTILGGEGYWQAAAITAVGEDRTRIVWLNERHGKTQRVSRLYASDYLLTVTL